MKRFLIACHLSLITRYALLVIFSLAISTTGLSYDNDCLNEVPPHPDDCPVGANPIHAGAANLHREVSDLQTYGNAPIEFRRIYNSRTLNFNLPYWELGADDTWQHNWNFEMRDLNTWNFIVAHKDVKLRYPDGQEYNFRTTDLEGIQRAPMAHIGDRLYKWQGNIVGHTLVKPNGWEYDFKRTLAPKYRLEQVRDGQGKVWYLDYDVNNRLIKIRNNFDRWIAIERGNINGVELITKVKSNDGREVSYQYDTWPDTGENILKQVNYPEGEKALYTYVGGTSANEGRPQLGTAVDPAYKGKGIQMKYIYNYQFVFGEGNVIYLVTGVVREERNLATDQLIVTLPSGGGSYPQILSGNGSEITRKYQNGLSVERRDEEGRTTLLTRGNNGFGYVISIQEPDGGTTAFNRDYAGRILKRVTALGTEASYNYNTEGFMTNAVDELGRVTSYERDGNNLLLKKTYPNGSFEEWTYNADGQPLTHRQRNGAINTYSYYGANEIGGMKGDLKTFTDPLSNVTTYTYDTAGNLTSIIDALTHKTQFTHNWRGDIKTTTYADNSQKSYIYNSFGKLTTQTDELGQSTTYTYDEYNRVQTVTDHLNRTTSYEYGLEPGCGSCADKDTITQITLPSGKRTEYTYDQSGLRLSQTVGAQSEEEKAVTLYSYDGGKNLRTVTDPEGHVTTYNYDLLNRRTNQIDALSNVTTWTFDAVGNRLTETRADNSVTTYQYDQMNRLTNSIDAKGAHTQMTYDIAGNLSTLIDARGNTYIYSHDELNRRESLEYPDSSVEYWNYDKVSNLKTYVTREGYSCTYTYDVRNRLKESHWDDNKTPSVFRTYDAAGRLLTLDNGQSKLTYTYNKANELLSETQQINGQPAALTVQYTYDIDGNREKLTYPDGTLLNYNYSARNQLQSLTENNVFLTSYNYDKTGNRTLLMGQMSGVSTVYTNDALNRLVKIEQVTKAGALAQFDYAYNSVHQRAWTKRNQQKGDVYGYDSIGQVTSVGYNTPDINDANLSETFESLDYDEVGNRQIQVVTTNQVNSQTSYTANNLNQYTEANSDQLSEFSYDSNGNLTAVTSDQLLMTSYQYDSQNRLTYASNANAVVNFTYDAKNRCVKREIGGKTTYFVWDNWNLIEERDGNGKLIYRYVHGPRVDELISRTDSNKNKIFYHHDALGNVTQLTDQKINLVEQYEYDVFGQPTFFDVNSQKLNASAYNNRFLFTGREYLSELGLYDYRNRVYSPSLGRFLQTDPIRFDAGDVNIYRYVQNNPINQSDPEGLSSWGSPGTADTNNWEPGVLDELYGYSPEQAKKEDADQKKMIDAHSDTMKDVVGAAIPAKSIPEKIAKWVLKEIWKKADPGEKWKKDEKKKPDPKDLLKDKEKDSDSDGLPDDVDSDDDNDGDPDDRDGDGIPDNEDSDPDHPNCG